MKLKEELVQHNQYGLGRITEQGSDAVTVEFFKGGAVRRFPYPCCFEKELRLAEPFAQKELEFELSEKKPQAKRPEYDF